MQTYQQFYNSIQKPFFAPPEWLFGLAWGIIYPLIAIAGVYLLYKTIKKEIPSKLIILFAINLVFNFLFTPIQLGFTSLWPASITILIILITLIWLEIIALKKARPAFYLLLPYLLWGSFATILQLSITFMN